MPTPNVLHRLALMDDIMLTVFDTLYAGSPFWPGFDMDNADALANAARASQLFNQRAIPVLWSFLPTAMPLLDLLPDPAVSTLLS